MKIRVLLFLSALSFVVLGPGGGLGAQQQEAGSTARRVIIFVWDGLRADDVTAENMPNKYPPAKPEVLRLLAPQRGLTAIAKSKPKTEKTTNGRLPELSNFESPPAEPGVYHD